MLAATAQALSDWPRLVVGDGPDHLLRTANVPPDVTSTSLVQGKKVAHIYAAADLFLVPSLTETCGQAVQEAVPSGLLVVGMQAGGAQDIISTA